MPLVDSGERKGVTGMNGCNSATSEIYSGPDTQSIYEFASLHADHAEAAGSGSPREGLVVRRHHKIGGSLFSPQ